jgi:cardiolipin synthase
VSAAFDLWWPRVTALVTFAITIAASLHAILRKRDARAAIGWVALIWLAPVVGALVYALLGINRIRRSVRVGARKDRYEQHVAPDARPDDALLRATLGDDAHLLPLAKLGDAVVRRPIVAGCSVTPLLNGDEAYPAMLDAIASARRSVAMVSYIFDNDAAGARFRDALAAAAARGVEVRVLVDAVGARYTFPSIIGTLKRAGVRAATFLPTLIPTFAPYANLRNHRKVLVVDGTVGFTGGMNVRVGHVLASESSHPVQDLHFRMEGPIVAQMMDVFAEDWAFTTGEVLEGERWWPPLAHKGHVLARGVSDGPDDDFEVLRWLLLGALTSARSRVRIATPYFLPDAALVTALNVAAMRGVRVEILLPERGNLPLVQWAVTAQLWQVLERGCRVLLGAPPFDHTKLVLIDDTWSLIGSANWDPRSLRLNFEWNVELYGREASAALHAIFDAKLARAREISLADLDARPFLVQVRDGIARLFSPYL